MTEKAECVAEWLGSSLVNGPLTELSLSRCVRGLKTCAGHWKSTGRRFCLRLDKDGLTEHDNGIEHKVNLDSVVFFYLPPDSPRTVVWVIKANGPLAARVWRCDTAAETLELYRLYHQLISRRKVGKTRIMKSQIGDEQFRKQLSDILSKRNESENVLKMSLPENKTQLSRKVTTSSQATMTNDSHAHNAKVPNTPHNNSHVKNKRVTKEDEGKDMTIALVTQNQYAPQPPPYNSSASQGSRVHGRTVSNTVERRHSSLTTKDQKESKRSPQRQVLVAATRNGRPVLARQRKPAMILSSTDRWNHHELGRTLPSLTKEDLNIQENQPSLKLGRRRLGRNNLVIEKHPLSTCNILSRTISYRRWLERSGNSDLQISSGSLQRVFNHNNKPILLTRLQGVNRTPSVTFGHRLELLDGSYIFIKPVGSFGSGLTGKSRVVNVTRSGSLNSQGSTSSESGNEGQPRSVLKKFPGQHELRKNVTFNSMTTVQIMDK